MVDSAALVLPPQRICIIGGPHTGKTTLAAQLGGGDHGYALISADDHIGMEWSAASRHIADLMRDTEPPWLAEGVALVRAIRKRQRDDKDPKPCDLVILLRQVWTPLTLDGQRSMAAGHKTIWGSIAWEVEKKAGIPVLRDPTPEQLAAALRPAA
jgi:hypothetical protein